MFNLFSGKFNRVAMLRIETDTSGEGSYVEIKSPFTIEFTITRQNLGSANTATFVVTNLNENTRSQIYKDPKDVVGFDKQKSIHFFAGYNPKNLDSVSIPQCFNGVIKRAQSYRQGTETRTEIEAYDGSIQLLKNDVNLSLPAGTVSAAGLKAIISSMGFGSSVIGNKYTDVSKRGQSVFGNPLQILQQYTNNGFYIDSGTAYALNQNEVLDGDIRLINNDNGLLGTPRKSELMIEIEMLFEPRLKPSQLIELQSDTEKRYDGVYKIMGITHRGVISGAVGGDCRTVVTMQAMSNYTVVFDSNTSEYTVVSKQ